MTTPPLPSTIGKRGSFKDPDGTRLHFTVVDEVRQEQSEFIYAPEGEPVGAVAVFQLIRYDIGGEELRLGYYILGKKPGMRGKWVWGQFATSMPAKDFRALFEKARQKGWL
jgi:hypothetical protein